MLSQFENQLFTQVGRELREASGCAAIGIRLRFQISGAE